MPNAEQRRSNRITAESLRWRNKETRLAKHICENCGQPGGHWVSLPMSLEEVAAGLGDKRGFYTCGKT